MHTSLPVQPILVGGGYEEKLWGENGICTIFSAWRKRQDRNITNKYNESYKMFNYETWHTVQALFNVMGINPDVTTQKLQLWMDKNNNDNSIGHGDYILK